MKKLLLLAGGVAGIVWMLRPSKIDSLPYANLIKQAGSKYGVDPKLIASIIKIESNFNPNAIGDAGSSYGLMQVNCTATTRGKISTARVVGHTGSCKRLLEPSVGIDIGSAYLRKQIDRYSQHPINVPIVAYNTGSAFTSDQRLKTGTNNYAQRVLDYYNTL